MGIAATSCSRETLTMLSPEVVASRDALADPQALDAFVAYASERGSEGRRSIARLVEHLLCVRVTIDDHPQCDQDERGNSRLIDISIREAWNERSPLALLISANLRTPAKDFGFAIAAGSYRNRG